MLVFTIVLCYSLVFRFIVYYVPSSMKLEHINKETLVTLYFHEVIQKCPHVGTIVLTKAHLQRKLIYL